MKAYLNPTVLRKDITRFAPLWGLYTVFTLMFLLLSWEAEGTAARLANNVQYVMAVMGVVNLIYALMAAILLFGDMFKPRMCNMLHGLPVRREGWFLTHFAAGLLFSVVPNAVTGLIAAALLETYCYLAFLWLAVAVLQYLFFFGAAVFCVMCAGNGLGTAAIYAITNFLAVLGAWLAQIFYEPLLYGVRINLKTASRFSPVVLFSEGTYVQTEYDNMASETILKGHSPEAWYYLYIVAALGVLLSVAALLIYRRRALERAGDFISAQPVGPVFLVIYTLFAGAVFYFVAEAISGSVRYLFLGLGLIIGFFTGRMLLERRVNVFRWRNLAAFGVFIVVFAASLGLTALDPIGVTRYVPEAAEVERVTLSPYSSVYSLTRQSCRLEDPADVEAVTGLHRDALTYRRGIRGNAVPVTLSYTLKNGSQVERNYYLPEAEYKPLLQSFYSRPECVLGTKDPRQLLDDTVFLECYFFEEKYPHIVMSNQEEDTLYIEEKFGDVSPLLVTLRDSFAYEPMAVGLIEAIYADCQAGTMSQWWNDAASVGTVSLRLKPGEDWEYIDITLYENNGNTLAYLESLTTE